MPITSIPMKKKLIIADDLLRPRASINLNYNGPNPERFYSEIPKVLTTVFRVHEGSIQEKDLSFSKGETTKLSCSWELFKDLDKFSYYVISVKLTVISTKGEGTANISIEGTLRTEYNQETIWQRSIIYEFFRMMWSRFFYESTREKYFKEGQRLISQFVHELKNMFHGLR
ncbi:MAG: hypothetical protein QXO19_03415 [Candidatus Aenigmatarchaeota archaeon]